MSSPPTMYKPNSNQVVPPGTVVSLVIPWAETWQSSDYIHRVFMALRWGTMSKIDLVPKNTKRPHNTVYIHFSDWYGIMDAQSAWCNLVKYDKTIKVFYNDSYFWKVRKSSWTQAPAPIFTPRIEVIHTNTQPPPGSPKEQDTLWNYSPTNRPPNPEPTTEGDDADMIPTGAANCYGCDHDLENQQGHYGGCIDMPPLSPDMPPLSPFSP